MDNLDPQQEKIRSKLLLNTVVRQVLAEIINEQRTEIISRARAKLLTLNVEVTEADISATLS